MRRPLDLVRLQTLLVDALARHAATDRCGLVQTLRGAPRSGALQIGTQDWVWTRTGRSFDLECADTVVRLQEPLHDPSAFDAVQWAIHTSTPVEAALTALSDAARAGTLADTGVPQVMPRRHRFRPESLQPPAARWLDPLQVAEGQVKLCPGPDATAWTQDGVHLDTATLPVLQQPFREALGDFDPFVDTPDIGPAATRRLADRLYDHARLTLVGFDGTPSVDQPLDIHDLRWSLADWLEQVLAGPGTFSIVRWP